MAERAPKRCTYTGPMVVCRGGVLDGFWFGAADWDTRRQAAVNMGYTPAETPGAALGYVRTTDTDTNPDVDAAPRVPAVGTVWRWAPAKAERKATRGRIA